MLCLQGKKVNSPHIQTCSAISIRGASTADIQSLQPLKVAVHCNMLNCSASSNMLPFKAVLSLQNRKQYQGGYINW